jgi:zinc protease
VKIIDQTLHNGLRLLLQPCHSAPVVSMAVMVGVGSADEQPGEEGLAHVHEHMLFKGTARHGVGEIARAIEASGGHINAYTSFDDTVYYATLSSRSFETGLDILSDAVQRPTFDPDELDRERKVILEEISRGEDDPAGQATEALFALAYGDHPYGRPIIGTRDSVLSFDRAAVQAFFDRWYRPSNMTLVIVGDVTPERALAAIERCFDAPPAPPTPRTHHTLTHSTAPRAALHPAEAGELYLTLAFTAPPACHPDAPALDLLRILYSYGESSPLIERLDRELGWVNDISAGAYMPLQPGLFYVSASYVPDPEHPGPEALLEQITQILTAPLRDPIRPEDLDRARGLVESGQIYQRQTIEGQARSLGHYATCPRGLAYEAEYYQQLRQLTPATLAEVAARTLRPEALSIVAYGPPDAIAQMTTQGLIDAATRGLRGAATPLPGARPDFSLDRDEHGIARLVLPDGPTLLFQEDRVVELVSLRTAFLGGLLYEDAQTAGLHNLLATLWGRSTASRSYADLSRETEELGSLIDGYSGRNTVGLQMDVLSAHLTRGLRLFSDVLRAPDFDAAELQREKRLLLEDFQVQRDSPGRVAGRVMQRALFGDHPYALDPGGNPHSLALLTRDHLIDHYRRFIQPHRMVLCAVGDFKAEDLAQQLIERLTAQPWLGGDLDNLASPPPPPASPPRRLWTTALPKQQAHLLLSFPGLCLDDPDRHTLEVLTAVLSGQGGRLFLELRDRQSLAYSVSAWSVSGLHPGYFALHIATAPETLEEAAASLLREVARLRDEPVHHAEIDRARVYLLGHHDIQLQRYSARAITMALDELYRLGYDNHRRYPAMIEAVTAADLQRLAARLFDLTHAQLVVVRPQEHPLPPLAHLGFGDPHELSIEEATR